MRGTDTSLARWALAAGLGALLAVLSLGGSVLAQSPSPALEPTPSAEIVGADLFPSADEVREIFGVDLSLLGLGDGLSQAWEGSDFDSETQRAQMAMYTSAQEEGAGPLTAVIIDVVVFESAEGALLHTGDLMFGDEAVVPGFQTELDGDLVWTTSFTHEDAGGAVIILVSGPLALTVTALAVDEPEPETEAEAIAQLVLDRVSGEPSAAP